VTKTTCSICALGVLLLACGGAPQSPEDAPAAAPLAPAPALAAGSAEPRSAPLVAIDLDLADDVIAAADLWSDATAGRYAPRLVVGDAPGARLRIMFTWRSPEELLHPCIDADTLEALEANTGISGTVACL
jgi:hypothetical protein